jgi:phosphoribosylamine--glycine ligase
VQRRALDEIVGPTLREMARRGTPYRGVLYAGLMIEDGAPRLIEYNVRLGDPEAQV